MTTPEKFEVSPENLARFREALRSAFPDEGEPVRVIGVDSVYTRTAEGEFYAGVEFSHTLR